MKESIQYFLDSFTLVSPGDLGIDHPVWVHGHGPSVILMHEIDGFGAPFVSLALRLSQRFRVYAPVFYGEVGDGFAGALGSVRAFFCMQKEFEAWRLGKTSPIADSIRRLASEIQTRNRDQRGVGVIGMCMTGGIVLAAMAHSSVAVGVVAQPSLPFQTRCSSKARRCDLGMDQLDIQVAAESSTPVLLLRYGKDVICPAERIQAICSTIPSAILPDQELQNKLNGQASHSTLTDRYRPDSKPEAWEVSGLVIAYVEDFLANHLG